MCFKQTKGNVIRNDKIILCQDSLNMYSEKNNNNNNRLGREESECQRKDCVCVCVCGD